MKDKFPSQESIEALKDRLRAEDRPLVDPPGMFDAEGAKFDPEYHVVNKETGEAVMNKNGMFRRRPQKPICRVIMDPPPDGGTS